MSIPLLDKILALASRAVGAGFNLGVGVAPTSPADGDVWNTASGVFAHTAGVTRGLALGTHSESFTLSTGQTTVTLTHTPASLADIQGYIGVLRQDPANFTNLAGKVVTFAAVPANLNGYTLVLTYTRLD